MVATRKKVFVGLSGGVDSSVSAALLKKAGYEVTGVFIKVWQPDFIECSWRDDMRDAMRVCAHLDIPFVKLDLEKEYKRDVVDYMIREYKAGRTPNPDIMCNKYVKFGAFFKWAMKNGADFVATGHYARIKNGKLFISKDNNKDQSYFLWTLTQKELSHTIFPVGGYKKSEVRKLAKRFGLITAEKKDSQGLCFIGKVDMKDFLKHFIKEKRGKVLDIQGVVIGSHIGAIFYTIGERHGFTVTDKTLRESALYVVAKNIQKNTITVSNKLTTDNLVKNSHRIKINQVNWISGKILNSTKTYKARIRYRQELESCRIKVNGLSAEVIFKNKQEAVTSGQSLVLYSGAECLGGGIIV